MNIITPFSLVENNWRFVSRCCIYLQCRSILPWGWRQHVTPKQGQIYTILHIVTFLQFHPSEPHISPNFLFRKRGGNETVNLLEVAKSLFLSLSLSLFLGFLSPCAKRESFNRRHKFQRGSCGTAIYQRLHHETLFQNTP
jgi:hypothetical protein